MVVELAAWKRVQRCDGRNGSSLEEAWCKKRLLEKKVLYCDTLGIGKKRLLEKVVVADVLYLDLITVLD